MNIIIYEEPGIVYGQPLPNDWHLPGVELKRRLESEGYQVFGEHETTPDPDKDIAVYYDTLLRPQHPKLHKKSVYISLEPPVVNPRFYERIDGWPYTRILTFSRRHCGGNRRWIPFPVTTYNFNTANSSMHEFSRNITQICAITSNKRFDREGELYSVRMALYIALGKQLDLYGRGWQGHPITALVNYRGECEHNYKTYSGYKTAISIENQWVYGYASEKYWTPLQAGCEIQRIGWRPDYEISECNQYGWSECVVKHIHDVRG